MFWTCPKFPVGVGQFMSKKNTSAGESFEDGAMIRETAFLGHTGDLGEIKRIDMLPDTGSSDLKHNKGRTLRSTQIHAHTNGLGPQQRNTSNSVFIFMRVGAYELQLVVPLARASSTTGTHCHHLRTCPNTLRNARLHLALASLPPLTSADRPTLSQFVRPADCLRVPSASHQSPEVEVAVSPTVHLISLRARLYSTRFSASPFPSLVLLSISPPAAP